jgi:hypothetical protein
VSTTPTATAGLAHPRARLVAEGIAGLLGLGALAWVAHADRNYCERHLMSQCYAFEPHQLTVAWTWRIAVAVVGLLLLFVVRPRAGRWAGSQSPAESLGACARAGLALVLAVVASEIGMRVLHLPHPRDKSGTVEVNIGEPNERYGWLFKASRAAFLEHGGRKIEYDTDAEHNRAPRVDSATDLSAPSILFVGESTTAGHGLPWDETYPAQVGKALGLQVVNLGVHGYGFDQQFLRLYDNLPRFQHPVAIITMYYPFMIDRAAEDTHAHLEFLGDEPVVTPVSGFWQDLHLARAWRNALPYRTDYPLELAAKIFRETDRLARERGAKAFFLAPRQVPGATRGDQYLLDELFTRQGLTVIDAEFGFVPIPDDVHPDTASTRRLADVVVAAMRTELAGR